jgi:hypothetical protein
MYICVHWTMSSIWKPVFITFAIFFWGFDTCTCNCNNIEILVAMLEEACLKKEKNQLIFTLFCEVKRGFTDACKIVPLN